VGYADDPADSGEDARSANVPWKIDAISKYEDFLIKKPHMRHRSDFIGLSMARSRRHSSKPLTRAPYRESPTARAPTARSPLPIAPPADTSADTPAPYTAALPRSVTPGAATSDQPPWTARRWSAATAPTNRYARK
jgi:hypothetical protein